MLLPRWCRSCFVFLGSQTWQPDSAEVKGQSRCFIHHFNPVLIVWQLRTVTVGRRSLVFVTGTNCWTIETSERRRSGERAQKIKPAEGFCVLMSRNIYLKVRGHSLISRFHVVTPTHALNQSWVSLNCQSWSSQPVFISSNNYKTKLIRNMNTWTNISEIRTTWNDRNHLWQTFI